MSGQADFVELCPVAHVICSGYQQINCNCANPACAKCHVKMEYTGSGNERAYYECRYCEAESLPDREQSYGGKSSDCLRRCRLPRRRRCRGGDLVSRLGRGFGGARSCSSI